MRTRPVTRGGRWRRPAGPARSTASAARCWPACCARVRLRRFRRGLRQHRRPQAAHDRPPVHPARRLAARRRFGADADRGAQGDLGAAGAICARRTWMTRSCARSTSTGSRTRSPAILRGELCGADDREGRSRRAAFETRHGSSRRRSSAPGRQPRARRRRTRGACGPRGRGPASRAGLTESSRAMIASRRALAVS